jgi:hypothetical protein
MCIINERPKFLGSPDLSQKALAGAKTNKRGFFAKNPLLFLLRADFEGVWVP